VLAASEHFSDTVVIRVIDLHFNAGQRLADASLQKFVARTRDRQNRGRFCQAVSFEYGETQTVQILLHLLAQGRSARDQITHLPAHSLMDREKDDRPKIEWRVVAYPRVELDNIVRQVRDPISAFAEARLDTPMEHFPECRNTD